jgi:hypothetical protein
MFIANIPNFFLIFPQNIILPPNHFSYIQHFLKTLIIISREICCYDTLMHWQNISTRNSAIPWLVSEHGPLPRAIQNKIILNDP